MWVEKNEVGKKLKTGEFVAMLQEEMRIISQRELAPKIFEMKLSGKLVQEMTQAGQFLHLRVPSGELLLRRPISLAEMNPEKEMCTIIYRVEGNGTEVFSTLKVGETVDVLGPLGNGFETNEVIAGETIVLIGGGIGVPPLYELSKQLVKKGAKVIHLFGFASREAIFYEEEFQQLGEVWIATDDGSIGVHGHVGNLIEAVESEGVKPAAIYACGPTGLLRFVDERFATHPRAYVSMEERMACGVGACYACVCHLQEDRTREKALKVCDEGPVFQTGKVVIE